MEKETINLSNHRIELEKRTNPKLSINYPFIVRNIKKTPKGKYLKEKQISAYVYRTYEEAANAALKIALDITNFQKRREKEKEDKRKANAEVNACDFYNIGDIIVNTWGYEQSNVEFYQVVEIKPKTILIRKIFQEVENGSYYSHGMACNVLPVPNSFVVDGRMDKLSYQLRVKAEGYLSQPESYYYFRKWVGKPEYCSWYA